MRKELYSRIALECGTPTYVFDKDELLENVKKLKGVLDEERIHICYAMKANAFLIDSLKDVIDSFEVCSPGEYHICERAGIYMGNIVLSGVYKEKTDVLRAMEQGQGRGTFTIESLQQLQIISECAEESGVKADVLIRVTSGNQFGVDESVAEEIIEQREKYSNLHFKGIQYYTGTQKKKVKKMEKELEWLDFLCCKLRDEYGFQVEELEYGPGLPAEYFLGEELATGKFLVGLKKTLESMNYQGKVTLEMGRYLVAECGYYFSKIVDIKINQEENYCMIDGGINHINYYGQTFAMKTPHITQVEEDGRKDEKQVWKICGALCTVGDVLVKNYPLKTPKVGDILVFERIGAYSVTEGIYLFLSRNLPKVYFYSKERGLELRRKELPTYTLNF